MGNPNTFWSYSTWKHKRITIITIVHSFTIISKAESTKKTKDQPSFAFGYFDKPTITQLISDIKCLKSIQYTNIEKQVNYAKTAFGNRLIYLRISENKNALKYYTFTGSVIQYGELDQKSCEYNILQPTCDSIINRKAEFAVLEGNWTTSFKNKNVVFNEMDTTIILGPNTVPTFISFGAQIKNSKNGYMTTNIPFPIAIPL